MRIRLNDSAQAGFPNDAGVRQLWYGLVDIDPNRTQFGEMTFSPEAVNLFIPKKHRQVVRNLVGKGIEVLASGLRPPFIERSTSHAGLPFKALAKYFYTGEALVRAGYRLKDVGETDEGKSWWLHENTLG